MWGEPLERSAITIFLCGDIMTGRGIDQILPSPCDPHIHEPYVRNARRYVDLVENVNGPIPMPAGFSHVWGDALEILEWMAPDARIINLETSITTSDDYWRGKGINYRMHPANIPCLIAAAIDVCSIANNHVIDWGFPGLAETLLTLKAVGLKTAGAGNNLCEATAPAVVEVTGRGRVLVFSFGCESSGIPEKWAATSDSPGVWLLPDLGHKTLRAVHARILEEKRPGDVVVASIHWGGNWGYGVARDEAAFARNLIDHAAVDVVHGHSSHHPKGIEVFHGKAIIYGCGDFINDYEGINGYEQFRGELGLMYFLRIDPLSGKLLDLRMKPTRMKNFRVNRTSRTEAQWLADMLNREGEPYGTRVDLGGDDTLVLHWRGNT